VAVIYCLRKHKKSATPGEDVAPTFKAMSEINEMKK
jgi:hypothetical protein